MNMTPPVVEYWGASHGPVKGQQAVIHRSKYPFGEHPTITTSAVTHVYPNGDFETGTNAKSSLIYYRKTN